MCVCVCVCVCVCFLRVCVCVLVGEQILLSKKAVGRPRWWHRCDGSSFSQFLPSVVVSTHFATLIRVARLIPPSVLVLVREGQFAVCPQIALTLWFFAIAFKAGILQHVAYSVLSWVGGVVRSVERRGAGGDAPLHSRAADVKVGASVHCRFGVGTGVCSGCEGGNRRAVWMWGGNRRALWIWGGNRRVDVDLGWEQACCVDVRVGTGVCCGCGVGTGVCCGCEGGNRRAVWM